MAKLSEQLMEARPTRTERVAEQQRREAFELEQRKKIEKQQVLKEKVDQASEKFEEISFEKYETEYNKLDDETKKFFLSPTKFKQTDEFKEFEKQKAEFDRQKAEFDEQQRKVEDARREQAEWEQAFSMARRGARHDPRSSVGKKIQIIQDSQDLAREKFNRERVEALKEFGVTPIKKGAVIVAFKDEFGNTSFDPKLEGLQFRSKPSEVEEIKPITQEPIVEDVKIDDRKFFEKSMEELFISPAREKAKAGILFVGRKIKDLWKKTPSGEFFYTQSKLGEATGLPSGTITPFRLSDKSVSFTEGVEMAQEDLAKKRGEILQEAIGKSTIAKLELGLKEEFDPKFQEEFEKKHLRSILFEEKTFEQAKKEFEEGTEAKMLQVEFQEKFEERFEQLSKDVPILRGSIAGIKIAGLSLTQLGLGAIKTPKSAVITGVAIRLGVGALRFIPPVITIPTTIGFGALGTFKTFSPTSTVEERGGGVITAVLSGVILGKAGVRFLRTPVIKTIKIPAPKISVKASEVIGKDIKIITEQGSINRVIFENQKLSQQVMAGRRTVVSTKVRKLLKIDPIFEGVPFTDPKGFQKALKKLTKFGFTEIEARQTLRFTAPRVTDLTLKRGVLAIKESKAIGEFEFFTEKPIIKVDKQLGIKTRGGRTVEDIIDVERQLIKTNLVIEERTRLSLILERGRVVDFKDFDVIRGVSIGKSKVGKGFDIRKFEKDIVVFEEAQIIDIQGLTISRKLLPSDKAIRIDTSNTRLIQKVIDARLKEIVVQRGSIEKTPFSRTFGSQKVDEVKDLIRSKPTASINKVIQQQSQILDVQQLKIAPLPDVKAVTKIKDIIKVKQLDAGLKIGSVVSTRALLDLGLDLKIETKLKQQLKSMIQIKDLVKTDTLLKTAQLPALKQPPALKQQLKLKQDIKLLTGISLITPTMPRTPKIPKINIPTFTIPFLLKGAIRKKQKKKKKGVFEEFALLPDFTARAIGLDPDVITGKQAQARIKKILTGLEIRRGAIIQ